MSNQQMRPHQKQLRPSFIVVSIVNPEFQKRGKDVGIPIFREIQLMITCPRDPLTFWEW